VVKSSLSNVITCYFIDDDKEYKLSYNLENWKNVATNGLFGGDFYESYAPRRAKLTFDHEYELEREEARELYETLYINGWR
jgi:hypothetical protein